MELKGDVLVSPTREVPVIEGELVATIRELAGRGVGSKTIARTVGVEGKLGAQAVVPGGWFAFQVPGNFDEPSHTIRRELAAEPAYAEHTAGVAVPASVLERDVLPARVPGYQPRLLDELGAALHESMRLRRKQGARVVQPQLAAALGSGSEEARRPGLGVERVAGEPREQRDFREQRDWLGDHGWELLAYRPPHDAVGDV